MSDSRLERLERATAELQAPFAAVDLDAFWRNAADMELRAAGKPIRLASKSVRCRTLQQRVLARPGFQGTLAFTLPEALWLAELGFQDIVVAYPTVDRGALRTLAMLHERVPAARVAAMVDSVAQLDLIESAVGRCGQADRVCIDVDAGLWLLDGRIRIGAKRSPVHTPAAAAALAREILARERLQLVGIMAYESQIAGLGDAPPGKRVRGLAIGALQQRSAASLRDAALRWSRRCRACFARLQGGRCEFVNGGGTGSLERLQRRRRSPRLRLDRGCTDRRCSTAYRAFRPEPAALFALPVVRKPSASVATVLGGGYLASGPADAARLPMPFLPAGLALDKQEGAGEVQTPLTGAAARELRVGDRVWFRHAKAGELCERFDALHLVEGERIVEQVPTYRGEGKCFL